MDLLFSLFYPWFEVIFLLFITDDVSPLFSSVFNEFISSLCAVSSIAIPLPIRFRED